MIGAGERHDHARRDQHARGLVDVPPAPQLLGCGERAGMEAPRADGDPRGSADHLQRGRPVFDQVGPELALGIVAQHHSVASSWIPQVWSCRVLIDVHRAPPICVGASRPVSQHHSVPSTWIPHVCAFAAITLCHGPFGGGGRSRPNTTSQPASTTQTTSHLTRVERTATTRAEARRRWRPSTRGPRWRRAPARRSSHPNGSAGTARTGPAACG